MAKRALCIGINDYPGTGSDLSGCVNDANDWSEELKKRGFEVTLLLDAQAKKAVMVAALTKITQDAGRDDISVITYSGHGTWVPDMDGDEADGRDEALCPHDIGSGEVLTDDELYEIFSERKRGSRIILISDSCHSGSVARMAGGSLVEGDAWKFQKVKFLPPAIPLLDDVKMLAAARAVEHVKAKSKIRAAAVLLSGCQDSEYSYDAWFSGRPNGAFTHVALWCLKQLPAGATYRDWMKTIRQHLPHAYYPQTPQLSGSYEQKAKWKVLEE